MLETWRLLDTGLASPARNIAMSRALLEARNAEESGSTVRFLRYSRSAMLASHHRRAQEINGEAGRHHTELTIQRRITGGSTWYTDERQLGWELYLHQRDFGRADMQAITKRVNHAAAAGLSALGCNARFRARDEIEIEGRTVCVTGHVAERQAILLQGLLFMDLDYTALTDTLRLPGGGSDAVIALARARMCGLQQVLGRTPAASMVKSSLGAAFENEFDMELRDGDLSLTEHARLGRAIRELDTPDWIEHVSGAAAQVRIASAEHRVGGGTLCAWVKHEVSTRTLRQVWFSGVVGLEPRALLDLEATLRDIPLDTMPRRLDRFFAGRAASARIRPADFLRVVTLATATRPSLVTRSAVGPNRS